MEKIEMNSPSTLEVNPAPRVQTAEEFLKRDFPPKEPLIEGLLYRRDIVAFAGRRRHGKTTFLSSLATALSAPQEDFLGYPISGGKRVVAFFLEDDAREIQDKLKSLRDCSYGGRLAIHTRDDFFRDGIPMDMASPLFRQRIEGICAEHGADLVVLDNLAHLIGADYSNAKAIHGVMSFAWKLTSKRNAAVIIAAHPRKRSGKKDPLFNAKVTLRSDPEDFFEEVMGSSHFVNSCGSLWGIERNIQTNRTDFLGGTQRLTGEHSLMVLEKRDDGLLRLVTDDWEESRSLVLNTDARRTAWELLPGRFSYTEAERAVKTAIKSSSTFSAWFGQLKRQEMVLPDGKEYRKAHLPGTPGK
jgi:hypothetical protein